MRLEDVLSVVHHETSPTRRNDEVFAVNPLGKVPVLICDDGTVLFDSNVICEYLDSQHDGTRLIPAAPEARYHALKLQALAQGIADAGIAARWESVRRPAPLRWSAMHAAQVEKIAAACSFLEREVGDGAAPDIGDIALVTALSWVEFRDVYDFLRGRPRLAHWYEMMCHRPSMRATALSGDTQD
jgi:glutathione S-transferase